MEQEKTNVQEHPTLKTILAAELFSKLSESEQDIIISQLKALLSHG